MANSKTKTIRCTSAATFNLQIDELIRQGFTVLGCGFENNHWWAILNKNEADSLE